MNKTLTHFSPGKFMYKCNFAISRVFFDVVSGKSRKIPSTLTSTVAHKGHAAN